MNNQDDTTLTHHMVDESQAPQYALEVFIRHFPYTRYQRTEDSVRYDILHLAFAETKLRDAKKLISELKLPLLAELRKGPVDASLILTLKP